MRIFSSVKFGAAIVSGVVLFSLHDSFAQFNGDSNTQKGLNSQSDAIDNAGAGSGITRRWVGSGDGKYWSVPENWDPVGVPSEQDELIIPSGASILIDESTQPLSSVLVEGTLVMSNWTTCLSASTVTIAGSGKITVAGLSRGSTTNRVWIVCDDMLIESGGKIDVNDLGFSSSKAIQNGGKGSYVSGPTKGTSDSIAAAHGGHGGYGSSYGFGDNSLHNVLPTADDISAPKLPGSGGYPQAWGDGTDGGGAVYISATDSVTVNGSILASVTKMTKRGSNGAGGSVLIECATFHGESGVIRADGGSVNESPETVDYNSSKWNFRTGAGGGGMIAIKYDPARQTADMVSSMTISAEAGLFRPAAGRVRYGDEKYRYDAGLGTVYLTDDTLLPVLVGKGLTGVLVNNTRPYVIDGDFTFSSGHVRFPGPAASVTVGGNLVISGDNVRLEVGGLYVTNRTYVANIFAGDTPNTLTVGGALTLTGGSRLDIRSAMTNATHSIGGSVVVGGMLCVETNCEIHCWSDDVNGGSPRITAKSFKLNEGGLVSGFAHGFSVGKGPGRPNQSGYGGSHGGRGGVAAYGGGRAVAFDDEWLPMMPGGGGMGGTWGSGGMGGGVVDIMVEKFAIIDGTIDVMGANGSGAHPCPGGAGGAILIRCKSFSGAATGQLLAHGGNGKSTATVSGGGGGGGGRIAVWTGYQNFSTDLEERRIARFADDLPDEYLGTYTISGGTFTGSSIPENFLGEDGTVRWVRINPPPGMCVIVR